MAKKKIVPLIYGIKNCDTMKKTFNWFNEMGIEYTFHNYKTEGISASQIKLFMKQIPLETLVNSKGTSYRALSDEDKEKCSSKIKAVAVMVNNPSLIKRPLIAFDDTYIVGYAPELWEKKL